jgi:hypothetical protein
MWVNVYKNVFGYYTLFQFKAASLQWFFIGYWILQTRLDFYPAFLLSRLPAGRQGFRGLGWIALIITMNPVSCILHLVSRSHHRIKLPLLKFHCGVISGFIFSILYQGLNSVFPGFLSM